MEIKGKISSKGLVILIPIFFLFSRPVLFHTVDRKIVYQGQQVILTSWIACSTRPEMVNWERIPSFDGFWMEEVKPEKRVTFLNIGKRGCWAYSVRAFALFPQRAGILQIGDGKARVFIRGKEYVVKGNILSVRVLALPPGADWFGDVKLSLRTIPEEGKIELIAEVEGNPDLLPVPKIADLKGDLIYVGSSVEKKFEKGSLKGKKKFVYLSKSTKISCGGFYFRVFDPKSKKIKIISSPSFSMSRKTKGNPGEIYGFRGGFEDYTPLFSMKVYWIIFGVFSFLLAGSLVILFKDKMFRKEKSSNKLLEEISMRLEGLTKEEFYETISRLIPQESELKRKIDHIRFSPFKDSIEERKEILRKAKEELARRK